MTVFSDDFSTNTNSSWTTSGQIGASAWSVLRSGDDWGGRRNSSPQQLELINDVSTSANLAGWVFAATSTTAFSNPYNPILEQGGVVTWTFNMRQIRSDPDGFDANDYGIAFILAGETATGSTDGNGYAVVLGQSGSDDPIRLVSYTTGIMGNASLTNVIVSNTSGLTDFGTEYLSIKVTYNPCMNNQWELFVRNDGTAFVDPESGMLISQGTVNNNLYTGIALNMMASYWQGSTDVNQDAYFDNIKVTVDTVADANAGSYGPVCEYDPDITLMGMPSGGIWTGIGVSGNTFNPNAGTQTLTYHVIDENGCTDTSQTTIMVNACLNPPEMRWVLLEEGEQTGNCTSTSNCLTDEVCYALQYTPNVTGTLTSYTSAFFVDCVNGINPIMSNTSCVMTSVVFDTSDCPGFNITQFGSAGNTGSIPVTQGIPVKLHMVCFAVPGSGTIEVEPDGQPDTSVDSVGGGGFETEFPTVINLIIDSSLACALLPLRFLEFRASRYGELMTELNWKTMDEINNDYFEVQRSVNGGETFEPIGIVNASTSVNALNHYQFIDARASMGRNHYRLKQFDKDGRFQYSPVRSVYFGKGKFSLSYYPNPVSEILNVEIANQESTGKIFIIDMFGRVMHEAIFENGNSILSIYLDKLMPGLYSLIVNSDAQYFEEKIVVIAP